jgi:cytochrome c-type biogenesis protein CcsB
MLAGALAFAVVLALGGASARAQEAPPAAAPAPAGAHASGDGHDPSAHDPHDGHDHAAHAPRGAASAEPRADLRGKVRLGFIRDLAVQDGGRRKPFDTFAREKVRLICGAERFDGEDPAYTALSLLFETDRWEGVPALAVKHQKLVALLGKKDPGRIENTAIISIAELNASEAFAKELAAIDPDDKMTGPFQNAVLELHHRRLYFYNLARTLRVAPVPGAREGAAWSSIVELEGLAPEVRAEIGERWRQAARAWRAGDAASVEAALGGLVASVRDAQGALAPPAWRLAMERTMNVVHPLRLSYGILLLAALLLGVAMATGGRASYSGGMALFAAGTATAVAGIVARTIIVERAPVGNLYEAATFGVVVALVVGLLFEVVHRNALFATAAAVFAALGSLLIDLAGMDAAIQPLVPVLRSYWLNIHVTCMLTSYGTFAIAFLLGIWYFARWIPAKGLPGALMLLPLGSAAVGVADLFFPFFGPAVASLRGSAPSPNPDLADYGFALVLAPGIGIGLTALLVKLMGGEKVPYERELELKTIERYTDRVAMVGLLIITAGILLGAVWANESWGRYWGWDPKETWAFITWMVYAVYVHGRIAGAFRGAAAAIFPVIGFYSVLFTFFGVSFVLPGLHSYLKS